MDNNRTKTSCHDEEDADPDVPLILVVDDDAEHCVLVRRTLEADGYQILEAADGLRALEIAQVHRPELMVIDGLMPKQDGFDTCAKLRDTEWGNAILVLIVTALDDEPSVQRAFAVGADDYIKKPISRSALRQRVRRTLLNSRAEKKLYRMAYQDTLTGLPNRRLFMDRLEQAMIRARRAGSTFALVFIDVDHFKLINDSLGHEAGDQVLTLLSERLVGALRKSDTVARLAGDEFTVVLEGVTTPQEVSRAAEKLSRSVSEPMHVAGQELTVTISLGIAMFPEDGDAISDLFNSADVAMYRAKHKGRNILQFHSTKASASAISQLKQEHDLREAIERQEFTIHYQPIVNLTDNRTLGVECFLRWNPSNSDIIYADKFIPLVEETELMVPLGEWVMRSVCQQCAEWRGHGYDLRNISINLSTREFKEPRMVSSLRDILDETRLEPECLEFELTEYTLMQDPEEVEWRLKELRTLGVNIAIDDFGTGWTSLAYLAQFPITTIKVDQTFVNAAPDDRNATAVIKAAVVLGRALDLNVIPEGVETKRQLEALKTLGCDRGQGHYWSKPLPAAEFEQKFLD